MFFGSRQRIAELEQAAEGLEGRDCFSRLPGYREIETPHQAVHAQALNALAAHGSGQSEAMLAAIAAMEAASMGVLAGLEQMAQGGTDTPSLLCAH